MTKLLFLLALFPSLTFGQVLKAPSGSFSGTAASYTATAASGSDAFIAVQGANLKLGTATLSFNGTALAASVGISTPSVTTTAASGAEAINIVSGSKICLVAGCARFASDSQLNIGAGGYVTLSQVIAYNTLSLSLRGTIANGATAVAVKSGNSPALTTAGAVIHGFYQDNFTTLKASIDKDGTYSMDGTDASGTPGAATINQPIGQVSVSDTASSVVVTNSLVTTASVVLPVLQFVDATCTQILSCVPAAGSFTITMNAACTADTKVGFVLNNYF